MASSLPYLGSKISLVSYAGIRYEGVLFNINTRDSTVGLSHVRALGTEGRKPGAEVPPSDEVFDYIVFRGKDIQDLTVSEPASHPEDPAIVAINPPGGATGLVSPSLDHHHHHHHNNNNHHNNHHFGSRGPSSTVPNNNGPNNHHLPYHHMSPSGRGYNNGMGHNNYYQSRRGGMGNNNNNNQHRGRHYGSNYSSKRVVGELKAQLNQSLKEQLDAAFDFEAGHKLFEKVAPQSNASAATGDQKENEGGATNNTTTIAPGYNRETSFFDTISCEALDRQSGVDTRVDRQKQRALDTVTFGNSALPPPRARGNRYNRRPYRRAPFAGRY